MPKRFSMTLPLWLVVLSLLLSACAPAAPGPTSSAPAAEESSGENAAMPAVAAQAQTVRLAIPADESTLTPYSYVFGYPGYYLMKLVYDSLLELDADNIPQPWLAESISMSDDGTVYTLTLREGITWHDGEALTAEDVKFTFEYYVAYPEQSRFARISRQVASIDTPDDATVVLTLSAPNPSYPLSLADMPILPQHIWQDVVDPKNFAATVGSGPYKLVTYEPEQFYRLEANTDYFMGTPTVAELVIPVIVEQSTMFSALRSGEIDTVSRQVPAELIAEFENSGGLETVQGPGFATTLLQFNSERPPFDDAAVRRAIAMSIDRQELVDVLLLGFGTVGNPGFVHPSSPFANLDLTLTYDAEQAAAMLEEAGYTDSDGDGVREMADGEPMSFQFLVYANNPERIRAAELIRDWVGEIGIELAVQTLDPTTVDSLVWPDFDVSQGRDFDLSMWGWSAAIQTDPTRLGELAATDPAIGGLNIGGYSNEAFDALAAELRATLDADARRALVQEMQALIAEELPFVPLYYADGTYAYQPDVYSGYVFVKGQGIINKLSFLPR
ncbi:ABC transporter substrate-binding protein [bacterium]|nr:ABC transporter substrate-binding protein [bacterium]